MKKKTFAEMVASLDDDTYYGMASPDKTKVFKEIFTGEYLKEDLTALQEEEKYHEELSELNTMFENETFVFFEVKFL